MSNTLILRESFDPLAFLETLEKEKVTILYAYPTMIHALVHHPAAKQYDYSALRLGIYGGSAMPLATLERAFEVFRCDFLQRYGATECCGSGISVLSPPGPPASHGGEGRGPALDFRDSGKNRRRRRWGADTTWIDRRDRG